MIAWWLACATPGADAPTCPPEGPFGTAEGELAADVAFRTCDGEPAALHDLCGTPALVTAWYGWCATCNDNAILGRSLADEHPALDVAVVLREDPLQEPVDAALCDQYAATFPSRAHVWWAPDETLDAYGTIDLVLVLDADARVAFVDETSTEAIIRGAVDAVLAP